jgi:ankyrin repeat protein
MYICIFNFTAENGRLGVVEKLLEKGADIRALNEDKLTPIDMAKDGETKVQMKMQLYNYVN